MIGFKIFPVFASEYFYIIIVSLGYWIKPKNLQFFYLSFLVAFSTLLNCLIKNIFCLPRPDIALHLIPVHDPFGFPSGDVQVATVFWLILFASMRSSYRYLCFLPIILMALSRLYLGVHGVYDVVFGFLVGFVIFSIWQKFAKKYSLSKWDAKIIKGFWQVSLLTIVTYVLISRNLEWPLMVSASAGALMGFCLALPRIHKTMALNQMHTLNNSLASGLGLIILLLISKFIYVYQGNPIVLHFTLFVKYGVIVYSILIFIPIYIYKLMRD